MTCRPCGNGQRSDFEAGCFRKPSGKCSRPQEQGRAIGRPRSSRSRWCASRLPRVSRQQGQVSLCGILRGGTPRLGTLTNSALPVAWGSAAVFDGVKPLKTSEPEGCLFGLDRNCWPLSLGLGGHFRQNIRTPPLRRSPLRRCDRSCRSYSCPLDRSLCMPKTYDCG
jgi:hypothetical protein